MVSRFTVATSCRPLRAATCAFEYCCEPTSVTERRLASFADAVCDKARGQKLASSASVRQAGNHRRNNRAPCVYSVGQIIATILKHRAPNRNSSVRRAGEPRRTVFYNLMFPTNEGSLVKLAAPKFLRHGLSSLNWQVCSFPSRDATGNFADAIKSAALQHACGNRRPVAARTIDQQGPVFGELFQTFRQMIERDAQTSRDVFLLALARRANVNGQGRLTRRQTFRSELRTEALGNGHEFRPRFEAVQSIVQIPGNVVEPDASEANCGFVLPARVRDDYNGMLSIEHGSRPRCVLAGEADVDTALQVRRSKFRRIARVEDLRARRLQFKQTVESERVHLARQRLVQCRPLLAVQHCVIGEVGRSFRLVGGHHLNECFFAHGLQRVVRAALLPQGGYRLLA